MARNGSGTYTKVNTFVAGTTITASDHNENWDDVATEITNSVAADGQTTMTGPLKAANGSTASPAFTFGSDTDSGFMRSSANAISIITGGVVAADFGAQIELKVPLVLSATATFSAPIIQSATASFPSGFISSATSTFTSNVAVGGSLSTSATAHFTGQIIASATSTFVLTANFTGGINVSSGGVTLPAGSINRAALPSGAVVNSAVGTYATNASITTQIPVDDTIPENTEGTEIVTATITPTSSSNKLRIRFNAQFATNTTGGGCVAALFQDSTTAALAATVTTASSGEYNTVHIEHEMTAGTTSATTFKINVGRITNAYTLRLNGSVSQRFFGGVMAATLVVEEIKA